MNDMVQYLFWPNPGNAGYDSPKVIAALGVCLLLVVCGIAFNTFRSRISNASLKRTSRTWGTAALWFGIVGCALVVARVEQIQFVAMRALWIVWLAAALLYVVMQFKLFRMRYYEVLPSTRKPDPRAAYLPTRKKRR